MGLGRVGVTLFRPRRSRSVSVRQGETCRFRGHRNSPQRNRSTVRTHTPLLPPPWRNKTKEQRLRRPTPTTFRRSSVSQSNPRPDSGPRLRVDFARRDQTRMSYGGNPVKTVSGTDPPTRTITVWVRSVSPAMQEDTRTSRDRRPFYSPTHITGGLVLRPSFSPHLL